MILSLPGLELALESGLEVVCGSALKLACKQPWGPPAGGFGVCLWAELGSPAGYRLVPCEPTTSTRLWLEGVPVAKPAGNL